MACNLREACALRLSLVTRGSDESGQFTAGRQRWWSRYHASRHRRHVQSVSKLIICLFLVFSTMTPNEVPGRRRANWTIRVFRHRRNLARLEGVSVELEAIHPRSPNEKGRTPPLPSKIERKRHLLKLKVCCAREVKGRPVLYIRKLRKTDGLNIWKSHCFHPSPTEITIRNSQVIGVYELFSWG